MGKIVALEQQRQAARLGESAAEQAAEIELGGVAVIVSGDADLIDIGVFRTIPILEAAQAVAMIEGQEST